MAGSRTARVRPEGLQPVQILSGIVGLIYLAIGIIGFVVTGISDFTGTDHTLLGFGTNPLHNIVHLGLGALGLIMMVRSASARLFGWILFVAYGAAFLWGLSIQGVFATNPLSGLGNPLNLNIADNWLHLGSAVVGLLVAVLPARKIALVEPDATELPTGQPTDTAVSQDVPTYQHPPPSPTSQPGESPNTSEAPDRGRHWRDRGP